MFVDIAFKIYLIWIILQLCRVQADYDPSQTDFCKLPCKRDNEEIENSACKCYLTKGYSEVTDRLTEFRQKVIDEHNKLRNMVATGEEKNPNCGEAANMMAVSYDLALEHVARCYAGRFVLGHDKCRAIPGFPHVGQNLGGQSNNPDDTINLVHIQNWYDEVKDIEPSLIDKYFSQKKTVVGHFTQLIWWSNRMVGCARVWNPSNNNKPWKFVMACNYAGDGRPNLIDYPVYKKGPKCSECPKGTSCNKKYPGLCGEIAPAPKDALKPLSVGDNVDPGKKKPSSATGINKNKIILSAAFIISLLL